MPRLFTGIGLPPDVATRLSFRRGGLPGARWIEPADYHVTLCFLGEIDDALARDAVELLSLVGQPPFTLAITGFGAFGGAKPRSVHAVVAPDPPLMALQATQERLLRRAGVDLEHRQFRPHVTLARLRAEAGAARTAEWLALNPDDGLTFTVDHFVLYSSRHSTGGGPYAVEEVFPLG